jgi:glycylpeptide N-tetradecanoyltransferase
MVEINFLCVHKKLRSKRLAPVLIKEVTRRTHLEGIFQAVYTAGVVLPKPMATCRYFHRSLNPKKLVETGFSHLARNMTMARLIKLNKLDDHTSTPGLRAMEEKDVAAVAALMNKYSAHFNVAPHFQEADVRHWLISRPGVVWGYVVEVGDASMDWILFLL